MHAFPLASLSALVFVASTVAMPSNGPAPGLVGDITEDVEKRWRTLSEITLADDANRDTKRFCVDLSLYGKKGELTDKEAKKAAKRIAKLVQSDSAPGFAWRAHELRGRLLEGIDPKRAASAYAESLDVYPNEDYRAPSKHSYFHHLAVHAALTCWSANGLDDAEQMLLEIAEHDERFQAFIPDELEARYLLTGQSERLKEFYRRMGACLGERLPETAKALSERSLPDARCLDGDTKKLFIVLGADREVEAPRELVVVMPGGSGQAFDFKDWIGRIAEPLLDQYVFAILSAPQWDPEQAETYIWVTEIVQRKYKAEFPVEEFAREVAAELRSDAALKLNDAYLFAWSSGGPATYATLLSKDDTFKGAYVLASVFHPNELDLKRAKGRRFWLEQGISDKKTTLRHAQEAAKTLEKHGAAMRLVEFDGGHGFAMPDAFKSLKDALEWLSGEEQ